MNTLDSRFCRLGDTFAQKFSRSGQYNYDFNLPSLNRLDTQGGRFSINVQGTGDGKQEGKQHFVTVRQEDKKLTADPPKLDIATGDVVLWSTNDPNTPGFSISGHSGKDSFNSAALVSECLYSHAFGSPDEIEWEDANGYGLAGKITVKMPSTSSPKEMEAFKATLTKGTIVVISGKKVEPAKVEISVGQTVLFAVEKAEGITITDRRLKSEIPTPQPPIP
jgi:plastocyanin